jgi:type IV pilus assembly protein PilB
MDNLLKQKKSVQVDRKKTRKAVFKKLRRHSEEMEAAELARRNNLSYLDLNIFPLETEVVATLSEEKSRSAELAVVHKKGKELKVGILDPTNSKTKKVLNELEKDQGYQCQLFIVSKSGLERAWEFYKSLILTEEFQKEKIELTEEQLTEFEKGIKTIIDLKQRITELPTTEVISTIIAGGLKVKASDIHLESEENQIRLRYRIDGVLQDVAFLPKKIHKFIVSRIKITASLKINVNNIPQNGHFEIEMGTREISIRVSTLPGQFGESIVLRLLDRSAVPLDLKSLGLVGRSFNIIQKEILKPNGMILNTGPTGSGKTTTLASFLIKVNKPGIKIITIEDPIEYYLEGISQTQVKKDKGLNFAAVLKNVLRQDPDIIMVGEIRDSETLSTAINAALTGHLVFSTLHTNSAAGAIPRMIDLGMKPSLIGPATNIIIAQRLVRKLCPYCREKYGIAPETIENIKRVLAIISPKAKIKIPQTIKNLYRAKGCSKCNNLGYKERIGIFEILEVDAEIEKLIEGRATTSEILAAALDQGMLTMLQDGILKALEGITSLEEVYRVTGSGDYILNVYEKIMAKSLARGIKIETKNKDKIKKLIQEPEKFEKRLKEISTNEIMESIVIGALIAKASDIHLEPGAKKIKVRYRIDGMLHSFAALDSESYPPLLSQIKISTGAKSTDLETVQEGRFTIYEQGKSMDARVSIIKGGYGETVVIRILSLAIKSLKIKELGVRKEILKTVNQEISKPNGIVLVTGPTGSGKTTTLYAFLNQLNKPETKIITVEDPIEYRLKGVLQTQVDRKKNYTFANALPVLLRQNPNIIMLGEIRDKETAKIAIESSLTGHLVVSTLHTNNAVGAITRLKNMNVEPGDIASSANLIIAQRLVRKLCPYCREKYEPDKMTLKKINNVLKSISKKSSIKIPKVKYLYQSKGCEKCHQIGYQEQIGVFEILRIDEKISNLISKNSSQTEIKKAAQKQGMLTMLQDGILKVLEGITSLEEVERVTK